MAQAATDKNQAPDGWNYKQVDSLAGGLNLSVRPDKLEDQETLVCKNIVVMKEQLQVDTGYKKFGPEIEGIPQGTFDYSRASGITELILITTETVYKWNDAKDTWVYIAGALKTTASVGEASGLTNIRVVSSAGAVVGGRVGILLNDGVQHKTTISSIPDATHILIVDAIPAGKTVAAGAEVLQALALSGNLDNQVIGLNVQSHEWLAFTNGVNKVQRYDGISVGDLPGLDNVVCRSIALYKNCLFLINTIEAGEAHPRRIRRSDSGDPTNWVDGEGTAGYNDLLDEEDPLQGGEVLGPYLIVYAERQIIRGEFVNTGGITFDFQTMIRGEGVISSYSMADVGDSHIVMCQSNIYAYRGGFDLEPVGDNVYYRLYGSKGSMSPANKHKVFAFYVEELDEVWFFFPDTTAVSGCNRLLRYNVGEKIWTERAFQHEFIGFGFFESRTSRPWSSLVGSWRQQIWRWNERTLLSRSPTTHLCCSEVNQVMEYDYVDTLDDGVPIEYTVVSKDFLAPDSIHRFDMIEMGIRGIDVLVQCSTDEGLTWMTLGTVNRQTMGRERMHLQFPFEKVRFRWSGASSFVLDWFGFYHKTEFET